MSEAANEDVLCFEGVSVRYGATRVVEDVGIGVERGSVFALLGRNGAGKSSLIRCLLGQQRPSSGRTRMLGHDTWGARRELMARVGVVPEEPDAPPDMTPTALSSLCRALYPRWDDALVDSLLRRSDVPRDVPFGKLSKGEKGAVMLALALAHGPELLVLDDPTLGLDAVARRALYDELIGTLADRGTTVFLASHDLEGIERLADRVAVLREHRIVVDEPLEELKGRMRRVRALGGTNGALDWQPFETLSTAVREWGSEAIVTNFSEAALAAFHAQAGETEQDVLPLSLEEIFLALAGGEEAAS